MKRQQVQQQKQITAYQKQVTYDLLLLSLEWLEKYIEVVYKNEFPSWEKRKQIHDNNIKRTDIDGNPEMAKDTLSTQLLLLESNLKRRPDFIREEMKGEYYKWISAVRIDASNCPEGLKQFLFGIHEILEGRGEKIRKDVENEKPMIDASSMGQMTELFAYSHVAAEKELKTEKSLEGKTYKDIEIESKFGNGNAEQGRQAFARIAESVSGYQNFHFFPSLDRQQTEGMDVDDFDNSTLFYQKDKSVSSTTPNSNNSSNNLETISLIAIVLALASLGIYGIVKKTKKIKK